MEVWGALTQVSMTNSDSSKPSANRTKEIVAFMFVSFSNFREISKVHELEKEPYT